MLELRPQISPDIPESVLVVPSMRSKSFSPVKARVTKTATAAHGTDEVRRTEAKCMEANLSSPRTLRLLFLIDTCMPEEEGLVHASRLSCAPSRRAVHEPSVRPSATSSARRSSSPVHSVEHHEEGRQCVVERVR